MAAEAKKHGPIRGLVQEMMGNAAKIGWRVGMLSGAVDAMEKVRDEALENLKKVPNHKLSAEAERILSRAIRDVEGLAAKLADIACGEDPAAARHTSGDPDHG